jgi:sugar/nucleoside kinase (ribokinase family)
MGVLCAGSWMVDFVAAHLPSMPEPGGLVYAPRGIDLRVGGHSANVAVDLVQLGQLDVTSAGCVGDDVLGRFVEDSLRSSGVLSRPLKLRDTGTAKNVALVVEGEDKRFVAEFAANTELTPEHVETALTELSPSVFYLGTVGGLKHIDPELRRVLKTARDGGAVTVLDVIMPENGWRHLTAAYPYIDFLHCNNIEAAGITGFTDASRAARQFTGAGVGVAIVSLGNRGLVAHNGAELIVVPQFDVVEVDPTGAGDALCAGLIHHISSLGVRFPPMIQLKEALMEASAAGAACVTETGATTSVTSGKVDTLLRAQGASLKSRIRVTS